LLESYGDRNRTARDVMFNDILCYKKLLNNYFDVMVKEIIAQGDIITPGTVPGFFMPCYYGRMCLLID
jgi:hypothetical protein